MIEVVFAYDYPDITALAAADVASELVRLFRRSANATWVEDVDDTRHE
ncbi:hypothetical protein [Burkholderia sp. BE17]|nr:hypothetical protein [Burkholderia sp. BE17]